MACNKIVLASVALFLFIALSVAAQGTPAQGSGNGGNGTADGKGSNGVSRNQPYCSGGEPSGLAKFAYEIVGIVAKVIPNDIIGRNLKRSCLKDLITLINALTPEEVEDALKSEKIKGQLQAVIGGLKQELLRKVFGAKNAKDIKGKSADELVPLIKGLTVEKKAILAKSDPEKFVGDFVIELPNSKLGEILIKYLDIFLNVLELEDITELIEDLFRALYPIIKFFGGKK